MGIFVNAVGANAYLRRLTSLNYNAPYTVLFSMYVLTQAAFANDYEWGIGGTSGYSSGNRIGTRVDNFRGSSASFYSIWVSPAGTAFQAAASVKPADASWVRASIRRTSVTSLILRIDGTDRATNTTDVTAREAVAGEVWFRDESNVANSHVGCGITNYKAFSAALAGADIDAEHLTTTVIDTANIYSASPMGSITDLATNLIVVGGNNWVAGTDLIVGANDPGVTYEGAAGFPKSNRLNLMGVG